jgi:nickel transport protein
VKYFSFIFLFASLLVAHDLHHQTQRLEAVVVSFSFAQKDDYSFQPYEIFAPSQDEIPFAVGRTDALGRVAFVPNVSGVWTLKSFGEDGHGGVVKVDVDQVKQSKDCNNASSVGLIARLLIGLATLFAIFGVLYFIANRRKNEEI